MSINSHSIYSNTPNTWFYCLQRSSTTELLALFWVSQIINMLKQVQYLILRNPQSIVLGNIAYLTNRLIRISQELLIRRSKFVTFIEGSLGLFILILLRFQMRSKKRLDWTEDSYLENRVLQMSELWRSTPYEL